MTTPFSQRFPIKSIADVESLEAVPLDQLLTVQSTYEIFRNSAQAFGEKIALTFLKTADPNDEPIRMSYAELFGNINRTANLLHRLGVRSDDAIAILLPACLDYHLALWGGEAAGIVQPLNPLLTEEKLASLMNAAQAKVLIVYGADGDADMWGKAERLRQAVPTLQHVLRVTPIGEAPQAGDFGALLGAEPDDRLVSGRNIAKNDIAAYFHTGGTTGAPKLARHSHGAQVFTAWAGVQMQGTAPDDVMINVFPLFHVAGTLPGALTSFSAGSETVIPTAGLMRNRAVITNYWRLAAKYGSTVMAAVPTVLAALTNVPVDADISRIRYCRTGAAPLAPELAARFKKHTGLHVHESLGMTEMAGISSITPVGVEAPAGCVGLRLPHTQWRIVALDEHGKATERDLPRGELGMVMFKSPNLFSGFVDARDNEGVITADGWLATGDLGWIDGEERLHLSGRSKDLIIRGGHNIDPKTIEDALGAHPAVQICAAVGAPDAYAGELPVLFATLVPGASATEDELLAYAAAHVDEGPARPKSVTILDTMPMTNVGKLYKPALRLKAAQAVVAAALGKVCEEAGVAMPAIEASEADGIRIAMPANWGQDLRERLAAALAPLPVKVRMS
ncbi:MAG: acyl-CoA synthetase [Burkholderiaceae bacterium]|nr:acyl-CoA synthetase [Burkholderiaceae bacterium]